MLHRPAMRSILPRHHSTGEGHMGRIMTSVTVGSFTEPGHEIRCDALVDTGAYCLMLPAAWKPRLGALPISRPVEVELADHRTASGEICGPVRIQIGGFEPVAGEVLFLEMEEPPGGFEVLIGYLTLEQARLVVDTIRHRLVRYPYVDLKLQRIV